MFSSGQPIYHPGNEGIFVPKIDVDVNYEQKSIEEGDARFKGDKFAQTVELNINPADYGVWVEYPELNKKVWLLEIEVKDASSINLILEDFELAEGAKLFFYDKKKEQVKGAITSRNNKSTKVLPVSIIKGNSVYCEIQLPLYQENFGTFTISRLGAGYPEYSTQLKSINDKYFGTSAACHVNVNCVTLKRLEVQKKSVCRIIYRGSYRCTGTLINNHNNDETPYVLTAAHCFNDEMSANEAVFYFNYESPDCSDTDVEPLSISGSSIVAAGFYRVYDSLDFILVKLSETPPVNYDVYYSGWDATNFLVDSAYAIHHPQGDIKKISVDQDQVETGDFGSYFDEYTHWYVADYEIGTSEAGSSGAGLIDQNGRLIGSLTGGGDTCGDKIDDYYQKFHHSYDDYKDSAYQLKYWLDPDNTGKLICGGLDPSFSYRHTAGLLYNFDTNHTAEVVFQESGDGYLAGHNYQLNSLFAERYKINGSKYLVGANLNLAMVQSNAPGQYVNFIVWEGGEIPGKIIYEQKVLVSDFEDVFIKHPDMSQPIEFDSTILVDNDFYMGYEIAYSGETFAMKTYPPTYGNSAYTYYNGSWQPLVLDGVSSYGHLAIELYAFDVNVKKGIAPDTANWPEVQIYPNPASDKVQVYFNEKPEGSVTCTLFDMSGQVIIVEKWDNRGLNMPLYLDVQSGVYILQVISNNNIIGKAKVLVF